MFIFMNAKRALRNTALTWLRLLMLNNSNTRRVHTALLECFHYKDFGAQHYAQEL